MKDEQQVQWLAENLKKAMRRQRMSQETLEAESGVTQGTISRILNARMNPSVTIVWRLAAALETSIDILLTTPREKIPANAS